MLKSLKLPTQKKSLQVALAKKMVQESHLGGS
jgi:hypothetical protein